MRLFRSANELKGRSAKIVMVAFDLLYLNGHDLRKLPLIERRARLKKLIAKTAIQFSDSFEIDGPADAPQAADQEDAALQQAN